MSLISAWRIDFANNTCDEFTIVIQARRQRGAKGAMALPIFLRSKKKKEKQRKKQR